MNSQITFLVGLLMTIPGLVWGQVFRPVVPPNETDETTRPQVVKYDPPVQEGDLEILERGPHHRVVRVPKEMSDHELQTLRAEELAAIEEEGGLYSTYTELAGGMHYWEESVQEWREADPALSLYPEGAVADKVQQKVIFARNVNVEGSIDLMSAEGVRLRSTPLALILFDSLTGDQVTLGLLKDSEAELVGENQIIYPDVFDNIEADLVYTVRPEGIEQDLVIREGVDLAALRELTGLPLHSLTTRLELMTEFFDPPQPVVETDILRTVKEPDLRRQMAEPDFVDEELLFGDIRIERGRTFWADEFPGLRPPGNPADAPVGKRWLEEGDRRILLESVEWESIEPQLRQLPPAQRLEARTKQGTKVRQVADGALPIIFRHFPERQLAMRDSSPRIGKLARAEGTGRPGLVLDYSTINTGSTGNDYTFKGNETYFVKGIFSIYADATIEGGTVIKYDAYNNGSAYYPRLYVYGNVTCKTDLYNPAIFTAKDDDTCGQTITGSSGSPGTNHYGHIQFSVMDQSGTNVLENLIMKNMRTGLNFRSSTNIFVRHCRFINCQWAVNANSSRAWVQNCLFDNVHRDTQQAAYAAIALYAYGTNSPGIYAENITVNNTECLNATSGGYDLSNSLLVDIDTINTFTNRYAADNPELSSANGVFQSAGAGDFYLVEGSPYRNAGVASIDYEMEKDFRHMTTQKPEIIVSDTILTSNAEWTQVVDRDHGWPDIGFHYPAVDFAISTFTIDDNVDLTVASGTAIMFYGPQGFRLDPGATLFMKGTTEDRVIFCDYTMVQEQPEHWGTSSTTHYGIRGYGGSSTRQLDLRFVDFYDSYESSRYHVYTQSLSVDRIHDMDLMDCRFFGSRIKFGGSSADDLDFKNNLFARCYLTFQGSISMQADNNLFYHCNSYISSSGTAYFWDNAFDTFHYDYYYGNSYFYGGNNYYLNSTGYRLSPNHSSDVVVTSTTPGYASGPFGEFYQDQSMNGYTDGTAGSTTVSNKGLSHYTARWDYAKDTGTVDIGLHYVASDGNGEAIDTDGDGIPDYIEDADGDGTHDTGIESDWEVSENGTSAGTGQLQVFTVFD